MATDGAIWMTSAQTRTDPLSPEERSARMALVRSRDTKPELRVRRFLHATGLRYRLHQRVADRLGRIWCFRRGERSFSCTAASGTGTRTPPAR